LNEVIEAQVEQIMTDSDEEDIFASLGGSLMTDILANLAVDEGDDFLTLEQLELELKQMDERGRMEQSETPTTAAGMVVSQAATSAPPTLTPTAATTQPAMDAWSLSLQQFAGSSLEQDFLLADSARKQQQKPPPPPPPGMDFSQAEDYDVTELAHVQPPPGIVLDQNQDVLQKAAQKLAQEAVEDKGKELPKVTRPPVIPEREPITPHSSMAMQQQERAGAPSPPLAPTPPPSAWPTPQISKAISPQQQHQAPVPIAPPLPAVPVAVPLPTPAWQQQQPRHVPQQQQQQQAPPPPQRVFANPHPAAPPIPAQLLASRYMKARDITFVVHGMLKPILAEPPSVDSYELQYWMRRAGLGPAGPTKKKMKELTKLETEMESRKKKADKWSKDHGTLGTVSKSNVARPRALIAVSASMAEQGDQGEQRQRAALWKSRIYCDQAYQAFAAVVSVWRSAPPGQVPTAAVQAPLIKLFKCLGMSRSAEQKYKADPKPLKLLTKLPKGKVLLARVLEQALLPPDAVQVLLPTALTVLFTAQTEGDDVEDGRLFAALAAVIQTLPELSGDTVLQCAAAVQEHSEKALSTQARMQWTHALLRRGATMGAQDKQFGEKWSATEEAFLAILSGMQ
jgi:hypothetical protein